MILILQISGSMSSNMNQKGERNITRSGRQVKLARRRRKLPTAPPTAPPIAPPTAPATNPELKKLGVEKELKRLSPEVLKELMSTEENNEKFMPGEVSSLDSYSTCVTCQETGSKAKLFSWEIDTWGWGESLHPQFRYSLFHHLGRLRLL